MTDWKKKYQKLKNETKDNVKNTAAFYQAQMVKPLTQVRFTKEYMDNIKKNKIAGYPFEKNKTFLFLGLIPDCDEHCAVIGEDGKVYWMYHADSFEVVPEEDR